MEAVTQVARIRSGPGARQRPGGWVRWETAGWLEVAVRAPGEVYNPPRVLGS
jgi:hypothetical protein